MITILNDNMVHIMNFIVVILFIAVLVDWMKFRIGVRQNQTKDAARAKIEIDRAHALYPPSFYTRPTNPKVSIMDILLGAVLGTVAIAVIAQQVSKSVHKQEGRIARNARRKGDQGL